MRPSVVSPAGHADRARPAATAVDWLRASVAEHPRRIAMRAADTVLTYRQLSDAVGMVGAALRGHGVSRGDRVVMCTPRGVSQSITVLAALDIGASVIPMAVGGRQRLQSITDLGPALVLTDDAEPITGSNAVALPALWGASPVAGHDPTTVGPDDLAYVLPTSGTTGRPKLVAVPHAPLANRLRWGQRRYPLGPGDVVLYISSMTFDFAFWELLAPLCFGAAVAVAPDGIEAEPRELARFIGEAGVTVAHFVPSLLAEFLAANDGAGLGSLRYVLCGGERLDVDLARRLRDATPARVFNQYGPTEACIDVVAHELDAADLTADSVPIGQPIDGVTVQVLEESDQAVADGERGVLHVGGDCLAWGYLGQAAATAAAFLPSRLGGPGSRMYHTGDLVVRRHDGALEYVGRVDDQVKLRGVRIEPAGVEAVLMTHPAVLQAAVVATATPVGRVLAGHVVLAHDAWDDRTAAATLRSYLLDRVPVAAVPAIFVRHAGLPRMPSGKIDRRALAAHPIAAAHRRTHDDEPRTATEQRLAEIWEDLLGLRGIGRSSDFFGLGGHSLVAMRMIARVRKQFGVRVPARVIFDMPTLSALGEYLDGLAG